MKSESEVRHLLAYFRQESVALEEKRAELLSLLSVPKDEAVLKRLQELADFMPAANELQSKINLLEWLLSE